MTAIKALRVDPDCTYHDIELTSLADFQAAVGGHIEGVHLSGFDGYVHEEGLLIGLPVNPLGTILYPGWTPIVGPILFVGPVDREGNDTDLPSDQRESLIGMCQQLLAPLN